MVAGGRPRPAGRACQSSGARRGAAGSLSCGGEYVRLPAARPPARVRTPHADGRTAGSGRLGGGAACTWGRAHPGPPACHGCGAALAPGRGTPGRDPSPRLLRGPEVNPGGPGAGRALLMAFPGAGPRLGSGFPRPAALSLTRCLAPMTRDRASRANSGCPGAPHGPGTPPTLRLLVPDTVVPTPQEPPLRASPASAVGARQPGAAAFLVSVRVWDVLGGSKALLTDIHPKAKHGPGKPVCLPGLSQLPAQRVICLFLFWFCFAC